MVTWDLNRVHLCRVRWSGGGVGAVEINYATGGFTDTLKLGWVEWALGGVTIERAELNGKCIWNY